MTNELPNLSPDPETTFERNDHGTRVREAFWTDSGMRSLGVSFRDGLFRFAAITHDDTNRRQATLNAHRLERISVDTDDDLALSLSIRANDGSPLTINLFGLTIGDLLEAVAKAVAEKNPITEDSDA
jgi:hypothetical protein